MNKILFFFLLCSSPVIAQNNHSDFQAFRKGMLENYNNYKKTILEDYAKYLQGIWKEYEEFKGNKRDEKPKPIDAPKAISKPSKTQALPVPDSKTHQSPISSSKNPQISISPAQNPIRSSQFFDVSFYGMNIKTILCPLYDIPQLDNKTIAQIWQSYQNTPKMQDVITSLQNVINKYELNDWFIFEFIRKYTEQIDRDVDGRIILQHFLLTNLGYDIRIAKANTHLLLLVPFKQKVYEKNYIVIDSKKYYVFHDNDVTIGNKQNRICTYQLPQNSNLGTDLDLTFQGKHLDIKSYIKQHFDITDGKIRLYGTLDKGLMEALRHYPQMDTPYYAMSTIIPEFHRQILEQMSSQIQGLSEKEAVNKILHFVQYAFKYATDREQHGYEKPYFIEENFYYPMNDCEDRAILFAFFTHNLLGLDVPLIQYPGHECTAVNFTEEDFSGDYYTFMNKTYYICDPTYIGATIGQCMPTYKNTTPIIEQWY